MTDLHAEPWPRMLYLHSGTLLHKHVFLGPSKTYAHEYAYYVDDYDKLPVRVYRCEEITKERTIIRYTTSMSRKRLFITPREAIEHKMTEVDNHLKFLRKDLATHIDVVESLRTPSP